jgi:hypothetical protein
LDLMISRSSSDNGGHILQDRVNDRQGVCRGLAAWVDGRSTLEAW